MLRVLAGDLSATFNLDGHHGARFVARGSEIAQKVVEQLILHDQVLIPTSDYLTAAGLIDILGENTVISLLEADQLKFIRLRQLFGYARGMKRGGGLIVFGDPDQQRPQDSPIETSIQSGLTHVKSALRSGSELARLLAERTYELELSDVVDAVRDQTYADLRKSTHWHTAYADTQPGFLRLPGLEKGQVRVLGPDTEVAGNAVDSLLALALANIELHLSKKFECISMCSGSPIGDSISLKLAAGRKNRQQSPDTLWSFLEVENVPNLAVVTSSHTDDFQRLVKLTRSKNCEAFRVWFANTIDLSEKEILSRYIELLHEVPGVSKAPVKLMRLAIATTLGLGATALGLFGVGETLAVADTLYVEKWLRGSSAKFFVDDLRSFSGKINKR